MLTRVINSTWVSQDCDNKFDFMLIEFFICRKFNMAVVFTPKIQSEILMI